MRILTVRQPWAWAIIYGGKDVENRVRNVAGTYRGPVAIHVGMADADNAPERLWLDHASFYREQAAKRSRDVSWRDCDRGLIIGVVELVGVHEGHNTERSQFRAVRSCYRPGTPFGPCSPWALPDHHHLELANPRPLATPIPYKGALGLRELPDHTERAVLAEVKP